MQNRAKTCWKFQHKEKWWHSQISMAAITASLRPPSTTTHPSSNKSPLPTNFTSSTSFSNPRSKASHYNSHNPIRFSAHSYRITTRGGFTDEDEEDETCSFDEAVSLFNSRDYYRCHDVLESLWNKSQDPARTLVHGLLQCAVGFHHLFNQVLLSPSLSLSDDYWCSIQVNEWCEGELTES